MIDLSPRPAPDPVPLAVASTPQRLWRVERRANNLSAPAPGPWQLVAAREGEEGARQALPQDAAQGDLVRLLDPDGVTRDFWVGAAPGGLALAPDVPEALGDFGRDWEAGWEGAELDAFLMVRMARGVDRRRLIAVGCDLAEECLAAVPTRDPRPAAALAAARGWLRGERSAVEAVAAGEAALAGASYDYPGTSFWAAGHTACAAGADDGDRVASGVACAVACVASVVEYQTYQKSAAPEPDPAQGAEPALEVRARYSGQRLNERYERHLRTLGYRVRRHVPLSGLLLSLVGAPVPAPAPPTAG